MTRWASLVSLQHVLTRNFRDKADGSSAKPHSYRLLTWEFATGVPVIPPSTRQLRRKSLVAMRLQGRVDALQGFEDCRDCLYSMQLVSI